MAQRILVGYDHSEEASAGLRRAAALALSERAELTVVHVAVPPPVWVGTGLLAAPLADDVVAAGELLVRQAVERLPLDIAVRWHLITGREASAGVCRSQCVCRALRRALDEGGHDLLVLGTGVQPGRVARALLRVCPDRVMTMPFTPQTASGSSAPKMVPSVSLK
jgi:nucleotide-binding universal stress UspA family protein